MMNTARRRAIASLLVRHSRVTNSDGVAAGCLCGAATARLDYYKHLAELIDTYIEGVLDTMFADHSRYRNNTKGSSR